MRIYKKKKSNFRISLAGLFMLRCPLDISATSYVRRPSFISTCALVHQSPDVFHYPPSVPQSFHRLFFCCFGVTQCGSKSPSLLFALVDGLEGDRLRSSNVQPQSSFAPVHFLSPLSVQSISELTYSAASLHPLQYPTLSSDVFFSFMLDG